MSASSNPLSSLIVRFVAESEDFTKSIGDIGGNLEDLGQRALKFGKDFAEGLSFVEITKEIFDAGETFENSMSKIERATGAVGEPLKGLEDSFAHTFGNVTQGADDVAGGLALLSQRTGATGDSLNTLVDINSKLAQVLDQQLRPTIENTQKILIAFGVTIDEQPAKLDALLAIAQKSGANFNTLVGTLQAVGPTLRAMGLDITDSAALLANFETHGVNAGRVASTLNQTLVTLAKEGFVDPKAALGEFLQKIIDAKDPTEALQTAAENFKGKGLVPLVDALQNGAANLAVLRDAAANSKGKIDETADSTQTLSEKFKLLEGATTKVLAPIGTDLVLALGHLVDAGTAVVKFIDSVVDEADKLDKKFGTSKEDITAYAGAFTVVAAAIANQAIPGLKSLGEEAADNKFIDGSMAAGLKSITDMFPNFGKGASDAQAKFEDLDKELKEAEKNLGDIERAVRSGIGTDADAAAARQKVIDVMQRMHPELLSIFTQTDQWNSAIAAGNAILAENSRAAADNADALAANLPTISAQTAAQMSFAIALQTLADLWPRDIQGIKDHADALSASNPVLNENYASMSALDKIIKDSQKDFQDQENTIVQNTKAFGPLHDAHILGISDLGTLKTRADESQRAFDNLAANGFDSSRHALEALATDLRDQINYQIELGNDTTDLQIKLDQTTEALKRQAVGFTDLYKSLQQVLDSDIKNVFNDLEFDISKIGDDFKKMGEDIVSTVTNRIIDAALKPWEDKLSSIITKASEAAAKSIGLIPSGVSIPGLPTGGPGTGGIPGIPTGTIGDIPTLPPPDAGTPVGSAASAASSSVSSSLSSVLTNFVAPISAAVSAISGVVGIFQNMHQETSLNAIELNTRITSILLGSIDATGKGYQDVDNVKVWTKAGAVAAQEIKTLLYDTVHNDLIRIELAIGKIGAPAALDASGFTGELANLGTGFMSGMAQVESVLTDIRNFSWSVLHPDLVGIWSGVNAINDSVKAGNSQKFNITGDVYIDAQELFASFVKWSQQSGTVVPSY